MADDSAGQVALTIYADSDLMAPVLDALERANGLTAGDPSELIEQQVAPFVCTLCLLSIDPDPGQWPRGTSGVGVSVPHVVAKDSVVLNDDGSQWKHGPRPSADVFDRSFVRVVALRLAM